VIGVDASGAFLTQLWPASPIPEEKRKKIGGDFIMVFAEEARKLASGAQPGTTR
jgi:GMP synthase PP-ATPase subunit